MASHDAANPAPDDSAESQTGHEEANDDAPPLHAAPLRFTGSWSLCPCFNDPISARPWAWRQQVNRGKATHFERRKLLILQVGRNSHTFPSQYVPHAAPTAWTTTAGSSHDAEVLPTA
jgi:hypothetical protein